MLMQRGSQRRPPMGSPGLCMKLSTLSGNPLELGLWNYDVKVDAHHSWRFLRGALMSLVMRVVRRGERPAISGRPHRARSAAIGLLGGLARAFRPGIARPTRPGLWAQ